MSITTTYKCDRCATEQTKPEQFWRIEVRVKSLDQRGGNDHYATLKEAHWCRKCGEALHLLPPYAHEKQQEELPPEPTFEDLLREIVREEIQNATGAV